MSRVFPRFAFVLLAAIAPPTIARFASAQAKIAPKVLVIATYETGKDRGDTPGELQYWVEREHLEQSIPGSGIRSSHPDQRQRPCTR